MMTGFDKTVLKRWMWGLGGLAIFFALAWKLERLATLVLMSFLVAYVLNPLVTRMEGIRFLGRTSSTLITMFGLLVGFFTVLFFIIPEVITEFRAFLGRLPDLLTQVQFTTIPWLEDNLGVEIPSSWADAYARILTELQRKGSNLVAPAAKIAGSIFGTTFSAVFAVIGTLMFPLFVFFLLKDFPRILGAVDALVPKRNKQTVHNIAQEVDKSLSAFLHGQFTVMLVLATLYSVGYSIVGVPVAIGVGLLTGLLCFIPYVGAATGFLLALLLASLEMQGWEPIAGVAIVFAVVQGLDAILITPRILGGKLGVKPVWIIVALMAGGELFGFLGILLAVPTTAVLKILVVHTIERYKKSALYNASGNEPTSDREPSIPDNG